MEDFKELPLPDGLHLEACPCCCGVPVLQQYQENEDAERSLVVTCNTAAIGGDDKLTCPMYLPKTDFYRPTKREAVAYWNQYAKALTRLARKNSWAQHSALRQP